MGQGYRNRQKRKKRTGQGTRPKGLAGIKQEGAVVTEGTLSGEGLSEKMKCTLRAE